MSTFTTAVVLAFLVGVIIGAVGLLSIANRNKKKEEQNVIGPIITKTETEITGCLSCGDWNRRKEGKFVYECQKCNDKSFWI